MKHNRAPWARALCLAATNIEVLDGHRISPVALEQIEKLRADLAPHDEASRAAESDVNAIKRLIASAEKQVFEAVSVGVPMPAGWVIKMITEPKQERWTQEGVANLLRHLGHNPEIEIANARAMGLIGGMNRKSTIERVEEDLPSSVQLVIEVCDELNKEAPRG